MIALALALPFPFALAACGPAPPPGHPTTGAAWLAARGGWRTLRAEQHVTVHLPDGSERSMRALLAVERPGRFRLRALGPGGITLFDVLSVDGQPRVLDAIKGASGGKLAGVVAGMAGDISAAYDLAPRPPARQVSDEKGAVIVREPERTVRLVDFRADPRGGVFPGLVTVDNTAANYRVDIRAGDTALDEPLPAELFQAP